MRYFVECSFGICSIFFLILDWEYGIWEEGYILPTGLGTTDADLDHSVVIALVRFVHGKLLPSLFILSALGRVAMESQHLRGWGSYSLSKGRL